jgi:hypothetical protein
MSPIKPAQELADQKAIEKTDGPNDEQARNQNQ